MPGALLLQDNFDRANSTNVVGPPQVGPSPTVLVGTWGINSNQLYASAVSSSIASIGWDLGASEIDLRVRKSAGALNSGGVYFGATSGNDAWYAYFSGTESSWLARYLGTTAFVQAWGKGGPEVVSLAAQLRVVHSDGIVQMWADDVLLLEHEPKEPILGTLHGVRTINTAHRWDDLEVYEPDPLSLQANGGLADESLAGDFVIPQSFLYKGRDTAAEDAPVGVA